MKRLLTLFIALIYLVMSTGFVMNSHYCMGKLSSIELGRSEVKKCTCGMRIDSTKKNKCCHSIIDVVKLEDSHKSTTSAVVFANNIEAVLPQFYVEPVLFTNKYTENQYLKKLPPNLNKQDTFKRIGVFLI
jgi:hypothetical protein